MNRISQNPFTSVAGLIVIVAITYAHFWQKVPFDTNMGIFVTLGLALLGVKDPFVNHREHRRLVKPSQRPKSQTNCETPDGL